MLHSAFKAACSAHRPNPAVIKLETITAMVTTPVTEAADMLAPLIALAGAVASAGDRLVCPAGTALGELRAVADAMVANFLCQSAFLRQTLWLTAIVLASITVI